MEICSDNINIKYIYEGRIGEMNFSRIPFYSPLNVGQSRSIAPQRAHCPSVHLINAPTLKSSKSGNFSSSVGNSHWTYLCHYPSSSHTYFVRQRISLLLCKGTQSMDGNIFTLTPSLRHLRNTNATSQDRQEGTILM